MRVVDSPGESAGFQPKEKPKKGKEDGRAKQIDLPKPSDLPSAGGKRTEIKKVEENAKRLEALKLPSVLLSCCKTAIEKNGLYFRAEKGGQESDLIGTFFKRLSGK